MFAHNLKLAFRNILQHKVQTIISVVGLTLGMVCFSMSFLWMRYISSYEDFVPDADRVYLVGKARSQFTNTSASYTTPDIISEVLSGVPEIEDVAKSTCIDPTAAGTGFISLTEFDLPEDEDDIEPNCNIIRVSDNFIDFFGSKVLSGNASDIKLNEIVLTESAAKRLFGQSEPVGQQVYVYYDMLEDTDRVKTVKAVIADHPDNTQFVYDALICQYPVKENRRFYQYLFYTFFKVRPGITEQEISDKLKGLKFKVHPWNEDHELIDAEFDFDLMPILTLRTDNLQGDATVKTQYVRIFVAIGILVILFSLVNYILTTVSLIRIRSRQMAIRRLSGASIWDIVKLNTVESLVIFLLSAIFGLIVSFLVLPIFKDYTLIQASGSAFFFSLVSYLIVIIAVGILIVGCTTLIVIRRTQASIIQGHQTQHSSSLLDKVSCILQLTLSIGMIFATLIMYSQLRYLSNSNALGFKRSDIIGFSWLPNTQEVKQKAESLPMVKEHLDSLSFIFPTNYTVMKNLSLLNDDGTEKTSLVLSEVLLRQCQIPFWQLEVIKGRMLNDDQDEMMINESALEKLGGDDVIGSTVTLNQKRYTIVGVLANIYNTTPMVEPEPAVYVTNSTLPMDMFNTFLTYKLYPGQKAEFLKEISPLITNHKLRIVDVEKIYNEKLKSEYMLMELLTAIGICGLLVSIMGAYSVISLSLQERRKEMALRKVSGAKNTTIMGLFLRSNLYSLLTASVIAFPSVYIIMHQWLGHFPKHISMPWYLIPVIILVLAILITLTVISKVYRASSENPADVLKE